MKKRPEKSGRRPRVSLRYVNVVDGGIHYLFHSSRRLIKQFPLRLLFGHAHVGFAVGKSDVQFLPLL